MPAFLAADLHLGHKGIHKYRKFDTAEAHDDFVEACWRKQIRKKNQTVYVGGDVAFSEDAWRRFDELPGTKVVILGNHCTEYAHASLIASLKSVSAVHGLLKYKEFYLSHAPIHPMHLRNKFNIHGHLHSKLVHDPRYFNISLEHIDYTPIPLEDIRAELERRRNWLYTYKKLGARAALIALRKL